MEILHDPSQKQKPPPVWHHGSRSSCRYTHYRDFEENELRFVFAHAEPGSEPHRYVAHFFDAQFSRCEEIEFATFASMRDAVARRAGA